MQLHVPLTLTYHARLARSRLAVFIYIRGKGGISAFVGGCHALVLWSIHLDLWLPFGVLTFFLNFIPAVGGIVTLQARETLQRIGLFATHASSLRMTRAE